MPLGHAPKHTSFLCIGVNSCKTPVATVCSFATAYTFISEHMHVPLTFLLPVPNHTIQRTVWSVLSQSFRRGTALFSSPSCHVKRQPVSQPAKQQQYSSPRRSYGSDPLLPEPWKRVKAQATDGRTWAVLWRNPTLFRAGELEGQKGRERGKRNGSG